MSKKLLKAGDLVMVIAGGNKDKRAIKGKTAKISKFINDKQRVILEGLNLMTKHNNPTQQAEGGIVQKETSMDISNVMYFAEKIGRPVKLRSKIVGSKKVRGYKDPSSKEFVEIL